MTNHFSFQRIKTGYLRLVEGQGFPMIVVVCVAVITGAALWTNRSEQDALLPAPTAAYDVSAAQLRQQLLRDALSATATPTATPQKWYMPLSGEIQQPFDASLLIRSGITGVWALHDAVDIAAPEGSAVCAIADGTVVAAGEDALQGVWLQIDHCYGMIALYAGMASTAAYLPGDTVHGGDVIGFCGSGPLAEQDAAPHLHLRVTQNGVAIDPQFLWSSALQ